MAVVRQTLTARIARKRANWRAVSERRQAARGSRLSWAELLEGRQLLASHGLGADLLIPEGHGLLDVSELVATESWSDEWYDEQLTNLEHDEAGATVMPLSESGGAGAALESGFSIPALNSFPSAVASIYLDFDGHFQPTWGSYSNITTPPLDLDGDPSTLSAEEVAYIEDVWTIVAEDFAPFQINVTTEEPAVLASGVAESAANGVALRLAIGGLNTALGLSGGVIGYAYINSFTSSIPNVAYVFPDRGGSMATSVTIATTVSHEAGHSFGLRHLPSLYDVSNRWQSIMNPSVFGFEDAYWANATDEFGNVQDDMAMLSNATNGFGYRADDYGATFATSGLLTVNGNGFVGNGIIGTNSDVDLWRLPVNNGESYRVTLDGSRLGQNLDAVLELLDASGNILTTSNSADSTDASLVFDGSNVQYLRVRSTGAYGRIGQYSLSVSPSVAGVSLDARATLLTSETGKADTITIHLDRRPASDVVVSFNSSNPLEGSSSVSSITFTPDNWYLPQSVAIVGQDDGVFDGVQSYEMTLQATSLDAAYDGASVPSLPALNADDDSSGWTQQIRAVTPDADIYTNDLEVDLDGSIVITGTFSGTVDFDPGPAELNLTANYINNPFVAKYSATGSLIWARSFGSTSGLTTTSDLVLDETGSIFWTGYTSSASLTLGSTTLTNSGSNIGILARMDANGQFVWARGWGGTGSALAYGLQRDSSGNLIVVGDFTETVDFNPASGVTSRTSAGSSDGYVTRFNSAGTFLAVNALGGVNQEQFRNIVLDEAGNAYLTGYFSTATQLGSQSLASSGSTDGILLKLTPAGSVEWVRQMVGELSSGTVSRLARTPNGNLTWAGPFNGSIDFGPGTPLLTSVGASDIMLSNWDATGNLLDTGQFSSSSPLTAGALRADSEGHLVLTGRMRGTTDLDPKLTVASYGPVAANGEFVVRMDQAWQLENVFILPTTSGAGVPRDLAFDARGNLIVANQYYDSTLTPTGDVLTNEVGTIESYLMKLNVVPGISVNSASSLETSEAGGAASFTLTLDSPPTDDVTILLASSDLSEGIVSPSSIVFNASNWDQPQLVTIAGQDDGIVDGDVSYSVNLTVMSADLRYHGLTVPAVSVVNLDDDQPQVLFADSFEISEWNGLWVEDSQNDWYRSNQRATAGTFSAEVDGLASNATLTMATGVNLSSYESPTLSFDWLMESSFDSGEYVSLDLSTNGGSTWTQDVRRLSGNVSPEDVWQNVTLDLTPYASTNFKIRFRSTVSGAAEDANVDNVRITAIPPGPNELPMADAGGLYTMNEGGTLVLTGANSVDPDGTIVSYAWDFDSDGQFDDATGVGPTFTTTLSGSRTVRLRVTDNRGDTAEANTTILVLNVAPTANAGSDLTGFVDDVISLSGTSSSDPGNDIVSYAWDLDQDGQYDDAVGSTTTFSRSTAGAYLVGLLVTDSDGSSSTDQVLVTLAARPTEVVLLDDSFEVSEWNGLWVEDVQNDWFRSNQRSTNGSFAAEVDGSASNATLTLASSISTIGYGSSVLTFDWFIESSFDRGEYLALDVSVNGGASWTQNVRRLNGNQSPEDRWVSEEVDLTPFASNNLRIRFRSTVSGAEEDGNVDHVKIVGVPSGAALAGLDALAVADASLERTRRRGLATNLQGQADRGVPSGAGEGAISAANRFREQWIEAVDQLFEWNE